MSSFHLNGRLVPKTTFVDNRTLVNDSLLENGANVHLAGKVNLWHEQDVFDSAGRFVRAAESLVVTTTELILPGDDDSVDVHFVSIEEGKEEGEVVALNDLLESWKEWVSRGAPGFEPCYLPGAANSAGVGPVGGWALKENLIWTPDIEVAENIRSTFSRILASAMAERQQSDRSSSS